MPAGQPFSLLIKPASGDCNLDCTYCFYLDCPRPSRQPRQPGAPRRMSANTLQRMISSYLKTRQPRHVFAWQGGEPTLTGIDFFKQAVKYQQEYATPGSTVANGLQTNALLIDRNFARFLARYQFLLGISLDGPAYIHDRYRKYKNGNGSYQEVVKGIHCLAEQEVEFNIVTLVTQANVRKGKEVYQFLCENGFYYHQYIECVEFDSEGRPLPYSITGDEWGNFLCEIFDQWIKSDICRVSIRLFDAILTKIVENRCTVCTMGPQCGQYFVVEYNGDIFPCDFYVRDELKLGNIHMDDWHDLSASPVLAHFAAQKSKWHYQCEQCEYQQFCLGDCPKNRFHSPDQPVQASRLCSGWKMFYQHSLPWFRAIAGKILQERGQAGK